MAGRARSVGLISVGAVAGVLVSLGISAYAFRDTRGPIPLEEIRAFTDVFGAVKANYVESVDDKKLMHEAISGMLAGLDPHSAYLDADAFKDMQSDIQGEFGGLGIEVGAEDGIIKVIAPIDDTPAARAGIKAGDLIIKIDETVTRGLTLPEAVKLMRGKPRTSITLIVARKGEDKPLEFKLMRDVIKVQSVKSKMIEPGYGFIRVSQFKEKTVDDLVKHINDLYKQGPLKGLVLDIRNDPGGLLHSAVGVSAAFLPAKSLVVSTDGRTDDATSQIRRLAGRLFARTWGRHSFEVAAAGEDCSADRAGQRCVGVRLRDRGRSTAGSQTCTGARHPDLRQRIRTDDHPVAHGWRQPGGDQADNGTLLHAQGPLDSGKRASFPTSSSKTHPRAISRASTCGKRISFGIWKTPKLKTRLARRPCRVPPPLRAAQRFLRRHRLSRSMASWCHRSATSGVHRRTISCCKRSII